MPDVTLARPLMRRKSSAQNLLSTFKRPDGTVVTVGGNPNGVGGVTASASSSNMPPSSFREPPSTAVDIGGQSWSDRDDAQSVMSVTGTFLSNTGTVVSNGSAATTATSLTATPNFANTSLDALRAMVDKRMVTLTYMRNVHDGRSHWINTILVTRADLDRVFNNVLMKKRTFRFAILAMSLANQFDQFDPDAYLARTLAVLGEYEASREEGDRPKMGRLFRTRAGKGKGHSEYYTEVEPLLFTPHMPFSLDYHQTLMSLIDVLSELYSKVARLLGPGPRSGDANGGGPNAAASPPLPSSYGVSVPGAAGGLGFGFGGGGGSHMMGPLGPLSPHPGVSYLFDRGNSAWTGSSEDVQGAPTGGLPGMGPGLNNTAAPGAPDNSLWAIANGGKPNAPLGAKESSWTHVMGENVVKIDGKLKKIIMTLLKELDTFARNAIKDELATLDPLLRNLAVADDGREQFDFENMV